VLQLHRGGVKWALERFFKSRDSAGRKVARQQTQKGARGCLEALADCKDGEKRLRQREMLEEDRRKRVLREKLSQKEMFILPFCPPATPMPPARRLHKCRNGMANSGPGLLQKVRKRSLRLEVALIECDCVIAASRIWRFCGGH
jgi:hypothetical protein